MQVTRANITVVLYQCLEQLNELLGNDHRLQKSPVTPLAGPAGGLDSLAFVNLVALVEEACQERFGRTVFLTDGNGQHARDPFESVATLAEYIELVLTGRLDARQ
jgi:hypothetical protein